MKWKHATQAAIAATNARPISAAVMRPSSALAVKPGNMNEDSAGIEPVIPNYAGQPTSVRGSAHDQQARALVGEMLVPSGSASWLPDWARRSTR